MALLAESLVEEWLNRDGFSGAAGGDLAEIVSYHNSNAAGNV